MEVNINYLSYKKKGVVLHKDSNRGPIDYKSRKKL